MTDQVVRWTVGTIPVAHLAGELDLGNAGACFEAVKAQLADAGVAVVDLSAVTFIDSTCVRELFLLAQSGQVRLVAPVGTPRRVLEISGVDQVSRSSRPSAMPFAATTAFELPVGGHLRPHRLRSDPLIDPPRCGEDRHQPEALAADPTGNRRKQPGHAGPGVGALDQHDLTDDHAHVVPRVSVADDIRGQFGGHQQGHVAAPRRHAIEVSRDAVTHRRDAGGRRLELSRPHSVRLGH